MWSHSERGSICGKNRDRDMFKPQALNILFLLASYNITHKGDAIMEIYCAVAEKRRSSEW